MKLQGEINKSQLDRDCNTPLSITERTNSQKISKDTDLSNAIKKRNKLNLIGIYQTFYPVTAEYMFFCRALRAFTKIDEILRYIKQSSKILKRSQVIQYTLC